MENLLVASHNKSLAVYRGNVLCWAARMDVQPVAVGPMHGHGRAASCSTLEFSSMLRCAQGAYAAPSLSLRSMRISLESCAVPRPPRAHRHAQLLLVCLLFLFNVQVRVMDMQNGSLRGMIVSLADNGHLAINYLGTDPMITPVGVNEVGCCEAFGCVVLYTSTHALEDALSSSGHALAVRYPGPDQIRANTTLNHQLTSQFTPNR